MRLISIGLLIPLLNTGYTQNCDYIQHVRPYITYYVYSPRYPRNYTAGVRCKWITICPNDYNCRLECPNIDLPESPACSMDRLIISKTGDPQLSSSEYYCGKGTLSITSDEERLSVGLISSKESPGGRFFCRLTAQPIVVTPAPCRCGYKKTNRIVGGQETGVNEYPMMAGIYYLDTEKISCGAVIISRRYVMSAAHCVIRKRKSRLAVVVGEHDVDEDQTATQVFKVTNITYHPLYTTTNNDNDISILKVHQDIKFSDRVGPVCLPFKFINSEFAGSNVTVLGWGLLFPGGPSSSSLQKVDLDVISQETCQDRYEQRNETVTSRQLCTFTPGKDACQLDSGGPLLYTDPSNGLLYSVGIVSYGHSCASQDPGINTRVTSFLEWVVVVTKEKFCKI